MCIKKEGTTKIMTVSQHTRTHTHTFEHLHKMYSLYKFSKYVHTFIYKIHFKSDGYSFNIWS